MDKKKIREAIASAYRSIGVVNTRLSMGIYKDAAEKKLLESIKKVLQSSIKKLEELDELQDALEDIKNDLRTDVGSLSHFWSSDAKLFVVEITDWLIGNYSDYYRAIQGYPSISLWEDTKRKTIGSTSSAIFVQALSSVDNSICKNILKAGLVTYSTEVGLSTGGLLGGATGFVVGVIADVLINMFIEGQLPDTAPGLSSEREKFIEAKIGPITSELQRVRKENMNSFTTMHDADQKALQQIDDIDLLKRLKTHYQEALKSLRNKLSQIDIKDRSLCNGMLKQWVLDYAGDEADAPSKHLPEGLESLWAGIIGHLKKSKNEDGEPFLPEGKGLSNIPTVFINQYKVNIQLMGLSLKSKGLAPFLAIYKNTIDEVMQDVGQAIEEGNFSNPPPDLVDRLYSKLENNHTIIFDFNSDIYNPSLLMDFLSRTLTRINGHTKIIFPGGQEGYFLKVSLSLAKDESSIFVTSLRWTIEPKNKNTGYYVSEENFQSGYEDF